MDRNVITLLNDTNWVGFDLCTRSHRELERSFNPGGVNEAVNKASSEANDWLH